MMTNVSARTVIIPRGHPCRRSRFFQAAKIKKPGAAFHSTPGRAVLREMIALRALAGECDAAYTRGMDIEEPIRIISDLHLGFSASSLEKAGQIAPLLTGVASVIFNGDTVETRLPAERDKSAHLIGEIAAACRAANVQPVFINGNHDPTLSAFNHADLCDGAVLVTHGDLLFHDISPWAKKYADVMGAAHTELLAEFDDDALLDFEKHLDASKRAALAVELKELHMPHGLIPQMIFMIRQCWPPAKPFQILKCWRETPRRAVALAQTFRPQSHIIILGHTHRAGVWHIGPRIIINTGSFISFAKCFAVDVARNTVIVRKVTRSGSGDFVLEKEIARFHATKLEAREGF
jgi:predicted phosphodiesterase